MASKPYQSDAQIEAYYAGERARFDAEKRAQRDTAKNQINSRADANQRSNYVNYRQAQRQLPEQMARMGLSGGASETSALRTSTNYENNYNNIENQRSADLTSNENAYREAMTTYDIDANQRKATQLANNRVARANWEEAQQTKRENRYAKTISGWDSISAIDKQIAKIKKSGKDKWRIQYLRARRAELKEKQGTSSSGGGGRSSRSYYSRGGSSGGSSGGNSGNDKKQEEIAKKLNNRNKGKSKKSSKKSLKPSFFGTARGMYWGAGGKYV